jgi:hypothetical protein
MNRLSYEDLLAHPEIMAGILERARRERSATVHRYMIAPVIRLFRAGRLNAAPRGLKYHRA